MLVYMFMCKKVFLAIFIIPLALRAKPKFQVVSVLICSSADCTFVLRDRTGRMHLFFEGLLAFDLFGRNSPIISIGKEKNNKVKEGRNNH